MHENLLYEYAQAAAHRPAWALVALLAVLLVGWRLLARARSALRNAERNRRRRRGERGERAALELLDDHGYRVVTEQPRIDWELQVDGEPIDVELRADALVVRDGRRWIVETKSGKRAPNLSRAATRRQLLEYRVAYDVDGVLLVDIERGRIRQIAFGL